MSMNGFQQSFMNEAKNAYNLNLDILEGHKNAASEAIDRLERNFCEIENVQAHMQELSNIAKLKSFFDELTLQYKSGLRKSSIEFTKEIAETYRNLNKKLKYVFAESGIGQKDIYKCIEENSEAEILSFVAAAERIDFDTELLSNAQENIAAESQRIIKKTERKIKIQCIYAPILILIGIMAGILINGMVKANENANINPSISGSQIAVEEGNSGAANQLIKAGKKLSLSNIMKLLQIVVGLVVWALVSTLLIFIALWMVYYNITSRKIRRNMTYELESEIGRICANFSTRRNELLESYAKIIIEHLNEVNTKYFLKFQPLIEQAMRSGED